MLPTSFPSLSDLQPETPEQLCHLADTLHDQGMLKEAIATYQLALTRQPDFPAAWNNLGMSLNAAGHYWEAAQACLQAISLAPNQAETYANIGISLKALGRVKDAEGAYRQALALKPESAETYSSLGNLLADQNRYEEAIAAYHRALTLKPDLQECRLKLALLLLPPALENFAGQTDQQLDQQLDQLANGTKPEDWPALGAVVGVVQPFALAYRPVNHTALLSHYGNLVCHARSIWFAAQYPMLQRLTPPDRNRLRLIIVSGQISNHSVWNVLLHGLLKHLDRTRFEVILYNTSGKVTDESTLARTLVARYHQGPINWTEQALQDQPDCIFYPEIAMDPATLQLAALRLAPLQIAGWGHPITSGLPTLDLFCSGELLEHPDADSDYREQLIRLPGTGACSILPAVTAVPVDPGTLHLPVDRSITRFLICQQAAKFDRSFDLLYPRIAQAIPACMFWFVRDNSASWHAADLEKRLFNAFSSSDLDPDCHIRIIDWLPGEQFLGLLDCMDIYLDTPAFSGYTTAWQALHRGLPVVTLEGRFMRQRLAAGLLRRIGLSGTIATDIDDYVLKVAALAHDPELQRQLRTCLKQATQAVDEDRTVVRAFEATISSRLCFIHTQQGGS